MNLYFQIYELENRNRIAEHKAKTCSHPYIAASQVFNKYFTFFQFQLEESINESKKNEIWNEFKRKMMPLAHDYFMLELFEKVFDNIKTISVRSQETYIQFQGEYNILYWLKEGEIFNSLVERLDREGFEFFYEKMNSLHTESS